jgi:hypothetical protein
MQFCHVAYSVEASKQGFNDTGLFLRCLIQRSALAVLVPADCFAVLAPAEWFAVTAVLVPPECIA